MQVYILYSVLVLWLILKNYMELAHTNPMGEIFSKNTDVCGKDS